MTVTTFGCPCVCYFIILTTDLSVESNTGSIWPVNTDHCRAKCDIAALMFYVSLCQVSHKGLSDWMLLIQCNMTKDKVDWTPKMKSHQHCTFDKGQKCRFWPHTSLLAAQQLFIIFFLFLPLCLIIFIAQVYSYNVSLIGFEQRRLIKMYNILQICFTKSM